MTEQKQWIYGCFPQVEGKVGAHYAVINRYGGSSLPPFASSNVGLHVGDAQAVVMQNRIVVQQQLGLKTLLFIRQVHGTGILVISAEVSADCHCDIGGETGCDALMTNLPQTGLAVQHADCQAVLLYDAAHRAIAAVHCGWRGSVQEIIAVTIRRMTAEYGTEPTRLQAFIGASLGPCCAEFINYKKELPAAFFPYMVSANHFDFHAISRMQLVAAGVKAENIDSLDICTSCSSDYFSYRRAHRAGQKQTGRNCTVIWLKDE